MVKQVLKTGKRKTAVARVSLKKGLGKIIINNQDLQDFVSNNSLLKLKVEEPLILSESLSKFDVKANVFGGGQSSQVDAIRQAIARGLVEFNGDSLKKKFLAYDRSLLVTDTRFKETNKPNNSKARAKRQKSYR